MEKQLTAYKDGWDVGAKPFIFTAAAGPKLEGTTTEGWYATKGGRRVLAGFHSREEITAFIDEQIAGDRITLINFEHTTEIRRVPIRVAETTLGLNASGLLVVKCDGLVYCLTPCCNASDKGVEDGVVCRACYGPIPDDMYDTDVVYPLKKF